jgi:hypothetical protein
MKIHLHIERLVVDAALAPDPRALEAALAEALRQALRQQPGLPLWQHGGTLGTLAVTPLTLAPTRTGWGQQFGLALYGALASSRHQAAGRADAGRDVGNAAGTPGESKS